MVVNLKSMIYSGSSESYSVYKGNTLVSCGDSIVAGWAWQSRQIDIMSEAMIYGQAAWRKNGYDVGCQKSQLSLFKHRHDMIQIEHNYY